MNTMKKASEEVSYVHELALNLLDTVQTRRGDLWRELSIENMIGQIERKALYLNAPRDDRFKEDLLDIINWAAFIYYKVEEEETNETGT